MEVGATPVRLCARMTTETPTTDSSLLVLFAHPALEKSRVNRRLADAVRSIPGVTFHDLYEEYPYFDIDVDREQKLLLAHHTIVLQHPFFWYSTPALLKQWVDLVLEHGWAYGSQGTALVGKRVVSAISTGGGETAYQGGGHNRHTIREFLAPIEQTFVLCGMEYLPPFLINGTHGMSEEQIAEFSVDYKKTIEVLRDRRLNLDTAIKRERLNRCFEDVVETGGGSD